MPMMKWISVKRQLPPSGDEKNILFYTGNQKYPHQPQIVSGYYECGRWYTQWGEFDGDKVPTYWMPFPPKPRASHSTQPREEEGR